MTSDSEEQPNPNCGTASNKSSEDDDKAPGDGEKPSAKSQEKTDDKNEERLKDTSSAKVDDDDDDDDQKSFPLSLHDSLALGDFELGLMEERHEKSTMDEIHRLPVLLRLLSLSRPLSSVPVFPLSSSRETDSEETDQLANKCVEKLEDVAAKYSASEDVDVVACHLAPSICRNLSKLAPLKKRKRDSISSNPAVTAWETNDLVLVGKYPRSSLKRRRLSAQQQQEHTSVTARDDDLARDASEGGLSSEDEETPAGRGSIASRRISAGAGAAEDSQEELVAKTLTDLTVLVVSALKPINTDTDTNDVEGVGPRGKVSLKVEDSTLSEPPQRHSAPADSMRGDMAGSDLGSTLVSLMHHAPVLRHQHVSNALCRATLPQTADLIQRMGANCPSVIPCLLRGCIDAYKSERELVSSQRYSGSSISKLAKYSILSLAELSNRERSRIQSMLQNESVMVDLQLELAMKHDSLQALCLLLQHLSTLAARSPSSKEGFQGNPFGAVISSQAKDACGGRTEWPVKISNKQSPSLITSLQESPGLLPACIRFLIKELRSFGDSGEILSRSNHFILVLKCCSCLFVRCDVMLALQRSNVEDGSKLFDQLGSVIQRALQSTIEVSNQLQVETGKIPMFLFSTCILIFASLSSFEDADKEIIDKSWELVNLCMKLRSKNQSLTIIVALVACHLDSRKWNECCMYMANVLDSRACSLKSVNVGLTFCLQSGFQNVIERMKQHMDTATLINEGVSCCSVCDGSVLMELVKHPLADPVTSRERVKSVLSEILDPSSAGQVLEYEGTPDFIVKATTFLASATPVNIPLISPLELERAAYKTCFTRMFCKAAADNSELRFLCQILYWFSFMDSETDSLFTFDPRTLPLKEALSFSRQIVNDSESGASLKSLLENFVAKNCPEVLAQSMQWELARQSRVGFLSLSTPVERASLKRKLSKALSVSLAPKASEVTMTMAERTFLMARCHLSDSDLFTQVASLLTSSDLPPPYCTYSMLCRDPLILLKAPMRVWDNPNLRRIVLSVLGSLLEAHEVLLEKTSPSRREIDELLSSRNALLLRALLAAVSGAEENRHGRLPYVCSMTSSFLRTLVARNRGLVALVVKQSPSVPENSFDWFVEFVPESMDDAESLLNVFSGRGSPTAMLNAASAILRVAIAHGHRNEAVSERLLYASLAQLVSSFFLVIGPVGVPVNVLIGDGNGLDVTQTARRATFRMLRALINVRGRHRTRLRSECGLALHKLAGLCKGESILSGVAGPVASRRKVLLREIYDAISKAANAMGSGIDL